MEWKKLAIAFCAAIFSANAYAQELPQEITEKLRPPSYLQAVLKFSKNGESLIYIGLLYFPIHNVWAFSFLHPDEGNWWFYNADIIEIFRIEEGERRVLWSRAPPAARD